MTQEPTSTEYTALDFDGTERRANYRTVAYRIDILHLCEKKDAAAILFEIIYRWQIEVRKPEIMKEIERRKKANLPALTNEEVEEKMWVWMSYNDFVRESGGAVSYNTVIRMLDYLTTEVEIVEQRENHDPHYPDYEYRIRLDNLRKGLKGLPALPAFLPKVPKKKEDSTQMGIRENDSTQNGRGPQESTQMGTGSTQNGRATTQLGREVYPNGGTSHTFSHTTHIQPTKEERKDGSPSLPPGSSQGKNLLTGTPEPIVFSSEEEQQFTWFCNLECIAIPPKKTLARQASFHKLIEHIHSQEDMTALAEVALKRLRAYKKGDDIGVLEPGNLFNNINAWKAEQKKAEEAAARAAKAKEAEQPAPVEDDPNQLVFWTRYQHPGACIDHWYLYEQMPLAEAKLLGWKPYYMVPSDRRDIKYRLEALAKGEWKLNEDQQLELEHVKSTQHLRMIA